MKMPLSIDEGVAGRTGTAPQQISFLSEILQKNSMTEPPDRRAMRDCSFQPGS
jgi:hypothetical protein